MPVYEFLCPRCETIYTFHSSRVDTQTIPNCPKCKSQEMVKQVSMFSTNFSGNDEQDEAKIVKAFENLADRVEKGSDYKSSDLVNDLRKFGNDCEIDFGEKVDEALNNLANGEDPHIVDGKIQAELMTGSFSLEDVKLKILKGGKKIKYDDTLYDLYGKV